jgi:hypothetical protein
MGADHVWLSTAWADPELVQMVTTDLSETDRDAMIEGIEANKRGSPVSALICPQMIWGDADAAPYERLDANPMPDLFWARGQPIVSRRAADIMRHFDLGGGALHPVSQDVWLSDRTARLPGEYFTWIFGNVKEGFLAGESREQDAPAVPGLWWDMPQFEKDDNVAVSSAVTATPDVWLDKMLFKSIFLSGPLGDALVTAGLRQAFRLFRCRVV